MRWRDRKVLVTGGAGFIGSHLVEALAALGADVRVLARYNSGGRRGWLEESAVKDDVEVILGDVCDPECVRKAVRGREVVFHLAALIGIPYSYESPRSYVRTNVEGTLNVLQASLEENVGRLVHTSTSEVYGTARIVPITESHPLQGQSPYSASKIGADKLAESYYLSFKLPVSTLRPFNTYGPRQSMRAVLPTIIAQALTENKVCLGSLSPTRDLNFVTDTVAAFLKIAEAPDAIGQTIHVGSGREISVGALARRVIEQLGRDIPVISEDRRQRPAGSEVERLCADNSVARAILGWEPEVSLDEGIRRTIEWMEKNLDGYTRRQYAI